MNRQPLDKSYYELVEALIPYGTTWLSVGDLAKIVGRSERFIYQAIHSGKLIALDFSKEGSKRPFFGIHAEDARQYLKNYGSWLTSARIYALTNYGIQTPDSEQS